VWLLKTFSIDRTSQHKLARETSFIRQEVMTKAAGADSLSPAVNKKATGYMAKMPTKVEKRASTWSGG
jgi:hypothetical protein